MNLLRQALQAPANFQLLESHATWPELVGQVPEAGRGREGGGEEEEQAGEKRGLLGPVS